MFEGFFAVSICPSTQVASLGKHASGILAHWLFIVNACPDIDPLSTAFLCSDDHCMIEPTMVKKLSKR